MNNIKCITSSQLKWIAIVAMTIDHIGAILFPQLIFLRIIGRIAFPIFCFLIVEGIHYTKNLEQYMLRLGCFAILSQVPFNYAFSGVFLDTERLNVFFTLFFAVFIIYVLCKIEYTSIKLIFLTIMILLIEWFASGIDYGSLGVMTIIIMYITRKNLGYMFIAILIINAFGYSGIQGFAAFACIPILLYNGKKGSDMKKFFYCYYPIHLIVLSLIAKIMM